MPGKINSLQMLRAFAVILVIFIHVINFVETPRITSNSAFNSFHHLGNWGAIGVDLFFSISGFIMTVVTPSYMGKKYGWKEFLVKRMIRITPLYYLVSMYLLVSNTLHHVIPGTRSILKTIFFLPIFDVTKFAVPILAVGWSLSYEIYFYLMIVAFIAIKGNIYKRLLVTILILSLAGIIFNPSNPILKFLMSPLLIEFGLGIIAGLIYKNDNLYKKFNLKKISVILITVGIFSMLLSIFTGYKNIFLQEVIENDNYKAIYRVLIWGIPSAIFLLGVVLFEKSTNASIPKLFMKIGDASFSIYLIHIKVYQTYSKLFVNTHLDGTMYALSAILVSIAGGIVFYICVETPLNFLITKYFLPKKAIPAPHLKKVHPVEFN